MNPNRRKSLSRKYARGDLNPQPSAPEAVHSDSQKAAQTLSPMLILAPSGRFAKPLARLRENAEKCGSVNRHAGRDPVVTGRPRKRPRGLVDEFRAEAW